MRSRFDWDCYFMTMAYLVAAKSKDPSTKVGAVIVGSDKEVRSTGYNGLPRGLQDTFERYERPLKYQIGNHAEENAILNCCRIGVSTKGCILYVPWSPCSLCAKSIIQAGIIKVIYHREWPGNNSNDTSWLASIQLAADMFRETGVDLHEYSGPLVKITGFYHEQEFMVDQE